MLQEVCVPVLQIKALQKTAAEKQPQRRPVDIVAYHPMIKLVNNIDKVSRCRRIQWANFMNRVS